VLGCEVSGFRGFIRGFDVFGWWLDEVVLGFNLAFSAVSNNLRSKEDLVSIHNGCVCCSLRKDILFALAELGRRSEQAGRPYDNVVLETTGLADPAPVAFTFFTNPWVKKWYHLDSIVYVTLCHLVPAASPPAPFLQQACYLKEVEDALDP
jgi:hypothetical protein